MDPQALLAFTSHAVLNGTRLVCDVNGSRVTVHAPKAVLRGLLQNVDGTRTADDVAQGLSTRFRRSDVEALLLDLQQQGVLEALTFCATKAAGDSSK